MRIYIDRTEHDETIFEKAIERIKADRHAAPTLRAFVKSEHKVRGDDERRAYEVELRAEVIEPNEKRRAQSMYGHRYQRTVEDYDGSTYKVDEFGGTWAEWGWFIDALFEIDYTLSIPAVYPDRYSFDEKTEYVFDGSYRHASKPATELQPGDVIVGYGTQGSGLRTVETINWHHNANGSISRRSGVMVASRQRQVGYRWSEKVPISPKRIVTIARYFEGDDETPWEASNVNGANV